MTPLALEVALTVQQEIQARLDETDRLRRLQVERAQYEAELARQRYLLVDPANRLVADTLEADWNHKLRACAEAQEHYDRQRQADRVALDEAHRQEILRLATDFPAVWQDPGRMMEAVHRYEGTVDQVMGDGIMALFGAPLAHEDHAVRVCYAALRMQESVRQYAEGIRRDEGVSIQIRVGVNSGDVVVRSIGSDLRMDYTAVGQTTHLAARMEQLAAPGSIVMAPETLRLAEGYVAVKPLGPVKVKGLSEPVDVYEVIRGNAVRVVWVLPP